MGKNNNVIINYLSDKKRFADMINAELYGGMQVIKPDKLTEISGTSYVAVGKKNGSASRNRRERRQDLYGSMAEKFSGFNKSDRLYPAYLLWVYYGEKRWDGPRTLKDMMNFGDDHDGFSRVFKDLEPHLLCINEMTDTGRYITEVRALFDLLRHRLDKEGLMALVNEDERYNRLDEETYETAAVLMNAPVLLKKRSEYADNEGRAYDMCKALRDWEADIRKESAEEIKQKDAEIEQKEAEIEQKEAEIEDLEKENALLRAKLEAAGLS